MIYNSKQEYRECKCISRQLVHDRLKRKKIVEIRGYIVEVPELIKELVKYI